MLFALDDDSEFVNSIFQVSRHRTLEFISLALKALEKPAGFAAHGFILPPQIVPNLAFTVEFFVEPQLAIRRCQYTAYVPYCQDARLRYSPRDGLLERRAAIRPAAKES